MNVSDEGQLPPKESQVGVPKQVAKDARPLTHDECAGGYGNPSASESTRNKSVAGLQEFGETATAIPKQVASDATPVKFEDSLFPTESDGPVDITDDDSTTGTTVTRVLRNPLIVAVLVLAVSGIVLVIATQALQFFQLLGSAPTFLAVLGYIVLVILVCAAFWAMGRLVYLYYRATSSPQIRLVTFQEMSRRSEMQTQLGRQMQDGYDAMRRVVADYPLNGSVNVSKLERLGFTTDEISRLQDNTSSLLKGEFGGHTSWLEECEKLFVKELDDVANRRVQRFMWQVAHKTAVMPTGLIDAGIVFTNAVLMVGDLCQIYNLRTTSTGTAALTIRVFANTFIASRMEDVTDAIAESFFGDMLSGSAGMIGKAAEKLTLGAGKRAAEGAANATIFWRLGVATIRDLRPIKYR